MRGYPLTSITVTDDGCGIGADIKGDGTGLAGARERLELMGGSLTVATIPYLTQHTIGGILALWTR